MSYSRRAQALVFALALVLLGTATTFSTEMPGKTQDHPIVIVNATIHPVSGADILNGMILFDKGKIVALGASITVPPNAEKIDAQGGHVYPGLIDAASTIGLVESEEVRATRDLSEVGGINPNTRAEVAFNPESQMIPVVRANGITVAVSMMSGGVISGSAAAMMMDGWTWEDMTLRAPVGMVVNWPNMVINRSQFERRSEDDQKKERDKQLNELRDAFKDARAYLKAKHAETNGGVPYHNVDVRWDAMEPVLDGKIPVLMNADELTQIEAAVAWADQEHVKLVIVGGYDSWRTADLLKARGVAVIVQPIQRLPYRTFEAYDQAQKLPNELLNAGVKFCIAGEGGYYNERNVPYHAAMAAGHGLPKAEALKSITIYAAQILGIDDRVGSLEVGKDATLIITTGDPLEISSNVTREFIQGRDVALSSHHTRLYDKYKEKYARQKASGAGK